MNNLNEGLEPDYHIRKLYDELKNIKRDIDIIKRKFPKDFRLSPPKPKRTSGFRWTDDSEVVEKNNYDMRNFTEYFKMNEDLDSELRDKLSNEYKSLKRGILELVEKTVEGSEKLLNVQNYMDEYVEDEDTILDEFVENSDVYDFYLKYQSDIDSLLSDDEFFDKYPSEINVYSLYDYVIEGTKEAVKSCMKDMYDELFGIKN